MKKKTGDGATLRRLRLLAGLGLDEVQELYPISPSRLSRAERDRADLSPAARAALERALSQEIRRRAKELNEFVRECDAEAEAVAVYVFFEGLPESLTASRTLAAGASLSSA